MKKKNNLKKYILISFVGFAAVILAFLWIFQVLLFGAYYQYTKTKTVENVAVKIEEMLKTEAYDTSLDMLAYENGVCIDILQDNINVYTSDTIDKGCLFDRKGSIYKYKNEFELSGRSSGMYMIVNQVLNNKTLVYAKKLDNGVYLYINTSIEPVESSVNILTSILIYITIMVFIIAILISLYLSSSLSSPILNINKKARKLAKGDFSEDFEIIDSNISEIEELNETLEYAKEELSKIEEVRRDLLANVSHDLKTPLTMIKAYAELTKDFGGNEDKTKSNMDIIIEESDRLNNLVNDILDLSKLQSEMYDLKIESFDIIDLIKTIIKRFNIYYDQEGYDFIFDNNEELFVNGDKNKIEQVIYNLIINAINYTGKDKKIVIKIKEGVNNFRIGIKDTGKGIDPEEIEKIWDKYYKNEKHHKRNKIGTGLGLSIVKNILLAHKFKYGVESKKGHGTEFYFDIPKENIK